MRFILVCLICLSSQHSFAWAKKGHRIVGLIAQKNLTWSAQRKIQSIAGHESLAMMANWMDFIRSNPEWRKANPWHYVSIPDGKTYKNSKINPKGDVIAKISELKNTLQDRKKSKEDKLIALRFLVHLIGDIHQPLHVGRKEDRGGNSVPLKWFNEFTNLHRVWDEHMIDHQDLSYTEYVEFIYHIDKELKKKWETASLMDWVKESQSYRERVYDVPKKPTKYWEYNYVYKNIGLVNQRLIQAGLRLAYQLNQIFK